VTPGVQGWLFADGNPQALAQVLIDAIDNRDKLKEMGNAARQLAEQRADWNKNFPELFKAHELAYQFVEKIHDYKRVHTK